MSASRHPSASSEASGQARRLPGVRFVAEPPVPEERLPRMDVAVIVGFAASGPLDTPVAVEDAAEFAGVFGEDLPIAWDSERNELVHAYLAPAVRAFFRNGGRRCWIVRVAEGAVSNTFLVPGLVQHVPGGTGEPGTFSLARVSARSEGSWSDAWQVGAVEVRRPIPVEVVSLTPLVVDVASAPPDDVAPGDVLRLRFRDGMALLLTVGATERRVAADAEASDIEPRVVTRVSGRDPRWLQDIGDVPPGGTTASAHCPDDTVWSGQVWTAEDDGGGLAGSLTLALESPYGQSPPPPGALLTARPGGADGTLLLIVDAARGMERSGGAAEGLALVSGPAVLWLDEPPAHVDVRGAVAEVLSFDLLARRERVEPLRVAGRRFAPEHPSFWGRLPTDEQVYRGRRTGDSELLPSATLATAEHAESPGTRAVGAARFPFAGAPVAGATYLPLGMPLLPGAFAGPVPHPASALARDGLATFDERPFLDSDMTDAGVATLLARADFLRWQSPQPRALRGIYAALDIDEATLIAVPDAAHRGWRAAGTDPVAPAEDVQPPERPGWFPFLACAPRPTYPRVSDPEWGEFLRCETRKVEPPHLCVEGDPGPAGTFRLVWRHDDGERFEVQEATTANFADAVTIVAGAEQELAVYGRRPGVYYYHVRAWVGEQVSDWSAGVVVTVAPRPAWVVTSEREYEPRTLLAVQRSLLRLCAARGDLLALLSLPAHFRDEAALRHVAELAPHARPRQTRRGWEASPVASALSSGEESALSYGALYHPWTFLRDGEHHGELRRTPPDGAVCGVLARRAIRRGAWIAPANEALAGAIALDPVIPRAAWPRLLASQVNLLQQDPRGFLVLSSDTLSRDPEVRPINVRRLLMLLRRLALRQSARYVFEPHDRTLARLVEREFEDALGYLFARGAFAGDTPERSFRVVTGNPPNSLAGREQGRFIVELRVAPSLPMSFITIRLVQTAERGVGIEER
jgi:hypothetical protein